MTSRRFGWVLAVLALGIVAAPRPARAQEEVGDEAVVRDRLATQILEAATVRMRAKADEARLLEAAGRPKEALAALEMVATIHDEALRLVRDVRSGRADGGAPGAKPAHLRQRIRIEEPERRPGSGWGARPDGLPPEHEPRRPATHDPVPAALTFLRSCQREDGWFSAARGQRPELGDAAMEERSDAGLTAFAVLAILDASEDGDPALEAVRDAANAIAADASADRDIGGTATAHVLASWALAAAYGRIGEASWREPLRTAVGRVLLSSDGRYVRGKELPDDDIESALWCLGLLYECLPLAATFDPDTIETAIDGLETAHGRADPSNLRDGSLVASLLLRRRATGGLAGRPGAGPPSRPADVDGWAEALAPGAKDPVVLLLGTVLFVGIGDPVEELHWWNRALVPALTRQVLEGPGAGSWPPSPARPSRAWETAVTLLAWKADAPAWREPVAR
jgi:hypothetical protein